MPGLATSVRLVSLEPLAGAALAAAAILATSWSSGGYFPPAWGWSTFGFALAVAAFLIVSNRVEVGPLDLALLGALGAFVGWTGLSIVWSASVPRSVLEVQRGLLYVAGVTAFLLLARRGRASLLVAGVLTAITVVAGYALATRFFPDLFGYSAGGPYQLSRPVGYWNALGILAAFGLLLAAGVVAEAPRRLRPFAAASVPVLASTMYFTFSRGAWVASAAGFLVLATLFPRPGRLGAAAALVGPFAAAAIAIDSRSDALTNAGAPLADAAHDGHRLAVAVALLTALAALASTYLEAVHKRFAPGRRQRRAAILVLGLVAAAALIVLAARAGRVYDAFRGPFTQTGSGLNSRLLSTSGNSRADYWRVALRTARDHPLRGSGAGTFDIDWYRERPGQVAVRDAHSLYLESLAELGLPGLILLGTALLVPLVAARRRRDWAAATAAAAYCAYLVHAALDWDWEVPAVTLSALACAAALLATARSAADARSLSERLRVAALGVTTIVAIAAVVDFAGAQAIVTSRTALEQRRLEQARRDADRATALAPWSSDALVALATAQVALGQRVAGRSSLRKAARKDPNDWYLWYQLGLETTGAERAHAAERVRRLNPLGPEAARLER
jgi:hypothetical protein